MRSFEYARPETEAEAVAFLNTPEGNTVVLAGGTDLLNLLKQDVLPVRRVVDLKHIPTLKEVVAEQGGLKIGAMLTLHELAHHPLLRAYRGLHDVIEGVRAIQIQVSGTLGGDLCLHPNCWYYRNGYGLLAWQDGQSLVAAGDNRYHAIFGNQGPAKFVSASRLAPFLIAWNARVRVVGPHPDQEEWLPLEFLYTIPRTTSQSHLLLKPGQFITHVWLPEPQRGWVDATYEVLEIEGLDWPLTAAAACLQLEGGVVQQARIVLGHVAPIPWVASSAAHWLIQQRLTEETASTAADLAVAAATPLSHNEYKVSMTRAAVKRVLLKAANLGQGASS
ncbi:MAG: FAD-binding molybdopterin dehydrogenase [Planctomycetaceae bacterium]|nr:MAG: FAD-binding molybdopterin dehydrogenase [Planctomycetaceae bacterium]